MVDLFTTTVIHAVEAEVPPPPRRQSRFGWCESAATSAAFNEAWTATENARQFLHAHPRDRIAWKTLRTACANLQKAVAAGIHAYFEEYLAETERLLAKTNKRGHYRHLKSTVGLDNRRRPPRTERCDNQGPSQNEAIQQLQRGFACCPCRQRTVENRRVPP